MKNIIALALVMLVVVGYGQDRTVRADAREGAQRARLQNGRSDGSLTRRESVALGKEQRHIRRSERRAKSDGVITHKERRKLDRKQDRASRNIRRQKHDTNARLTPE